MLQERRPPSSAAASAVRSVGLPGLPGTGCLGFSLRATTITAGVITLVSTMPPCNKALSYLPRGASNFRFYMCLDGVT